MDLVEMDDQYTHEIDLAADLDTEDSLSAFDFLLRKTQLQMHIVCQRSASLSSLRPNLSLALIFTLFVSQTSFALTKNSTSTRRNTRRFGAKSWAKKAATILIAMAPTTRIVATMKTKLLQLKVCAVVS